MIDDPMNCTKVKRGVELPWSKLTEEDVRLIRQLAADRKALLAQVKALSNERIGEKFGVHRKTIEKLLAGRSWSHV